MSDVFISVGKRKVRRWDRRHLLILIGVVVMIAVFAVLNHRVEDGVKAADLSKFDPGFIISDYQMGNYKVMSEKEIQTFLTKKNPCNNKDKALYDEMVESYPNIKWHFENGHFICLSEEKFGDGEVIGKGDTAAHIIWQAAQDYKINPQVLIVLLQKEQGLITDTFPNSRQYRAATGYGCPDTAACSSKYYGFKNQVRNAAAMFRTVLDGGWTNYPLGKNYIQYNPNASCGGSMVDVKNLATSALYRYTPYQPNAAALAAGYGLASCGAYGNRNFYLYFEDWFGGITDEARESSDNTVQVTWEKMSTPRYMTTVKATKYYDVSTSKYANEAIANGEKKYYATKTTTKDGNACLRTSEDEKKKLNRCVLLSELKESEWTWAKMETPRYMIGDAKTVRIDLTDNSKKTELKGLVVYYNKKTVLPDGRQCLLPERSEYSSWCAVFETLKESEIVRMTMSFPRKMKVKKETNFIDENGKSISKVKKDDEFDFTQKVYLPNKGGCLFAKGKEGCILESDLAETWNNMEIEREMVVLDDTYKKNIYTKKYDKSILMNEGMKRKFVSKTYDDGNWCLRTEYDDELEKDNCVAITNLDETWNELEKKETKTIKAKSQKIDALTLSKGITLQNEEKRVFTSKLYVFAKKQWCYRTEYDTKLNTNYCFLESNLK